jgi:predicted dinucleotide-binding enzyme
LSPKYKSDGGAYTTIDRAASENDLLVLATPWPAVAAALQAMGDLSGKTIVDCTNPLGMDAGGLRLTIGHSASGAEHIASLAAGAFVIKAFNSTGFENMARARDFSPPPVMFVAGDDADRKALVMRLAGDLGFEPVDGGPLQNARLLEPFAMVWIDQGMKRGAGRDFAFAITRIARP